MTFEEAMESLKLKFTSGNPIEVERATILRKEWEALLPVLNKPFQQGVAADAQCDCPLEGGCHYQYNGLCLHPDRTAELQCSGGLDG